MPAVVRVGVLRKTEQKEAVDEGPVEDSPGGRFRRFGKVLHKGAYMEVFRAEDRDTRREVAWSIINLSNLARSQR